ncbi:MAG: hypothetical protein P8X42_12400 [Calditrichaceae bacterium]
MRSNSDKSELLNDLSPFIYGTTRLGDNKISFENRVKVAKKAMDAGGPVHQLRNVPGAAWKEYLQRRAVEVAPIFERSGIKSWTEFCMQFAHSFPQVKATVGSTGRLENLDEYFKALTNTKPLPDDIINEIVALQYRWSDELDIHAEPWSM